MEKITYLPNGQWALEKAKKEDKFTFKHQYSDEPHEEKGWTSDAGADKALEDHLDNITHNNLKTNSGPSTFDLRRHWFSVHHPDHGELPGLIPMTTRNNNGNFEPFEFGVGSRDLNHYDRPRSNAAFDASLHPDTRMARVFRDSQTEQSKLLSSLEGDSSDAQSNISVLNSSLKSAGISASDILHDLSAEHGAKFQEKPQTYIDTFEHPKYLESKKYYNDLHNNKKPRPAKYSSKKKPQSLEDKKKHMDINAITRKPETPLQ
jgi:hypothetical protein